MKYNISTDKQELYSAEFEKYDGLAVAKKLQRIIKTYNSDDFKKGDQIIWKYKENDDGEYTLTVKK